MKLLCFWDGTEVGVEIIVSIIWLCDYVKKKKKKEKAYLQVIFATIQGN